MSLDNSKQIIFFYGPSLDIEDFRDQIYNLGCSVHSANVKTHQGGKRIHYSRIKKGGGDHLTSELVEKIRELDIPNLKGESH